MILEERTRVMERLWRRELKAEGRERNQREAERGDRERDLHS
jgi:hypothetical protein